MIREIVTNLRLRRRVQPGIDLGAMLAVFQVDFKVRERFSRTRGIEVRYLTKDCIVAIPFVVPINLLAVGQS